MTSAQDAQKRLAAEAAVDFIRDGMDIGLGTGSTMRFAIERLGERVRDGLRVRCLPTSEQTALLARREGIPLAGFSEVASLDLAIDGADEIDPAGHLIKGGGGALFREKMIASGARALIVVADETKLVTTLGAFSLPVEVVPFGHEWTSARIAALGCTPVLRGGHAQPYVTDNGNFIVDCAFGQIPRPAELERTLLTQVGVVECGLFVDMHPTVIVGRAGGVEILPSAH